MTKLLTVMNKGSHPKTERPIECPRCHYEGHWAGYVPLAGTKRRECPVCGLQVNH